MISSVIWLYLTGFICFSGQVDPLLLIFIYSLIIYYILQSVEAACLLFFFQGPPGTGKTQTILGLLSAILHATPARMQSRYKHAVLFIFAVSN